MRGSAGLCALTAAALLALGAASRAAPAQAADESTRTRGWVMSNFVHTAHGDEQADCPDGLNISARELFLESLKPAERARLSNPDNRADLQKRLRGSDPDSDACTDPAKFQAPSHKRAIFTIRNRIAHGMDLDGGDTSARPAANTCRHENFTAPPGAFNAGTPGIDNQFWRAFGCIKYYRPGADIAEYAVSNFANGMMTYLLEVTGLDDEKNDPEIELHLYAGADPAATDSAGNVTPGGSVAVHEDRRYHARWRASLKDGVITTEVLPELVLLLNFAGNYRYATKERQFRDVRLRLELLPDGKLKGMMGFYYDVDSLIRFVTKQSFATSVNGSYNCPGLYDAIHAFADGHPDPVTGKCSSISAAFTVEAVPAFVIHPKTRTAEAGR